MDKILDCKKCLKKIMTYDYEHEETLDVLQHQAKQSFKGKHFSLGQANISLCLRQPLNWMDFGW